MVNVHRDQRPARRLDIGNQRAFDSALGTSPRSGRSEAKVPMMAAKQMHVHAGTTEGSATRYINRLLPTSTSHVQPLSRQQPT
jgi:hypothetical protein